MDEKSYKIIATEIRDFVKYSDNFSFTSDMIDRDFKYITRDAKRYRWQILQEMVDKKELIKTGIRSYRKPDNTVEELRWWESDETENSLELPLYINNYSIIPRGSLVIIAGKYNAGKSAFCLNGIKLNLEKWWDNITFYVSEGAGMIKQKFALLDIENGKGFKTYRRMKNFADVINPNGLTFIDYLRVDMEKPYAVGEQLFEIFQAIDTGIVVVAMQKPPGERKLAFGGASTAFEPALYLGMESNGANTGWIGFEKIKIVRAYGGQDPYSVKIEYRIKNGVIFYDVHEKYE